MKKLLGRILAGALLSLGVGCAGPEETPEPDGVAYNTCSWRQIDASQTEAAVLRCLDASDLPVGERQADCQSEITLADWAYDEYMDCIAAS